MSDGGNPYAVYLPAAPTPTAPAASAAPDSGPAPNPYDVYTQPQAPGASIGSVGKNIMAGVNKTLADIEGFPVDFGKAVHDTVFPGQANIDYVPKPGWKGPGKAPMVPVPSTGPAVGSSDWIKQISGANVEPQNEGERIAQGSGSGIGAMLTLPLGARGIVASTEALIPKSAANYVEANLPKYIKYAKGALGMLGETPGPTALAAGGVGGGVGQAAADSPLVPADWKPTVNMAGNLAGGGLVAGTAAGVKALGGELLGLGGQFIKPLYESGRQQLAGQKIASAAPGSSPADLALKLSPDNAQLVPGSKPTTAQLAPELGQLDRGISKLSPQPFLDRAAEQNAARVAQVNAQAPAGAAATAPGEFFRTQLAGIDRVGLEATKAAQGPAAGAVEQLGGQQFTNPAEYGQNLRGTLADQNAAAKKQESALWQALPMDAPVPTKTLIKSGADITGQVPTLAKPMSGEEKAIFDTIGQLPPTATMADMQALRSRISTEIRAEVKANGSAESPVVRRLIQAREALDGTLEDSIDKVHEVDQQMVAAGHMAPEDTAAAKLSQWQSQLQAEAEAFKNGQRNVAVGSNAGDNGTSAGGPAGAGSTSVLNAPGAEGAPAGQSGGPSGSSGVSGEALPPQFVDQAALDAYKAARQATFERKQIFRAGPVGQVLASGPNGAPFRVTDSNVAKTLLATPEAIDAALKAGANRPELAETLKDYLAYDLRQKALGEDGTLNSAKFERWMENPKNSAALDKFPELQALFENAGAAQSTVEKVMAAHKAALDSFQNTAAKVFLKNEDPLAAVGKALTATGPGSASTMADLVKLASADKTGAALGGLKKAVVDYVLNKFTSNVEGGDTGVNLLKADGYQNFVKNHGAALRQLFGDEGLANFKAVAEDLKRTNRSIQGSNLRTGSDTAQNMAAAEKARSAPSVLGKIITEAALEGGGAAAGMATAGPAGAVGGFILGKILAPLRAAGLQKVDQLVTEAMLNPELAKTLLSKITPKNQSYIGDQLRTQLGKLATTSVLKANGNSIGPAMVPDASAQPAKPPAASSIVPVTPQGTGANPVADQLLRAAKPPVVTAPAPSGPGSQGGLAQPQSFLHTRTAAPNQLAQAANKGRHGDTLLAHINPHEARLLASLGGSGTINPKTGLLEFWEDGGGAGNSAGSNSGNQGNGNGGGGMGGNSNGGDRGGISGGDTRADPGAPGGGNSYGADSGGYNGQGRGAGGFGLTGGDLGLSPQGTTQTGESAFQSASAAYKSRTLGDRILSGLEGIVGFGDVQPSLTDSASYSMGTYHSGFNPGAVLGGLAGLGFGVPGLGMLGGLAYHAFGGTDVVTGGAGAPPGETAMKGFGFGGSPSAGTQMAGGTPAMSGNQPVGNGYGGGQGGGAYGGGGGDYSSTPLSRAAAQQSASATGYAWPHF